MKPVTLKLLPGLRWKGKLRVIDKTYDGRYLVDFDAVSEMSLYESYIYDRTELTADQLREWTGWTETK
jgi:hypothetical protein